MTCQHLKRPELDRRLASGEPLTRVAQDYGLTPSSLYRHRTNCLGLGSANAIKKEAARGTAAVALLPSKETLAEAYQALRDRIDGIVAQAQQEGSLRVALAGLSSVRATLDSLARLTMHDGPDKSKAAAQAASGIEGAQLAEQLIKEFDQEPELKARIAVALGKIDDEGRGSAAAERSSGSALRQVAGSISAAAVAADRSAGLHAAASSPAHPAAAAQPLGAQS